MKKTPENRDEPKVPAHAYWTWKKIAGLAGAGAALVGATIVATLAATHRTAVRENAIAYLNGVRDGGRASFWIGLLEDGYDDDDY